MTLGIIARNCQRNILHHDGFTSFGWCNDQATLAFAYRSDQIDDATSEVFGRTVACFEYKAFIREERREVFEQNFIAGIFRLIKIDFVNFQQSKITFTFFGGANLAGNSVTSAKVEAANLAG